LERSQVAAPVSGVIVRDSVEEGAFVQKGAALFVIEDTSSIEVQCSLRMDDLYWLWRQRGSGPPPETAEQTAYQVPQTPASVVYEFAGREGTRYVWQGV